MLGAVVVGVEAAHQALAGADGLGLPAVQFNRLAADRLAAGVQRQHLDFDRATPAGPAAGAHAQHHRAGPQRHGGGHCLHLAVGVVEAELGGQRAGAADLGQVQDPPPGGAVAVGGQRLLVGHQPALIGGGQRAVGRWIRVDRLGFDRLGRREAEGLVAGKLQLAGFEQRAAGERQLRHRTARQPGHAQVQRQVLGRHHSGLGLQDARVDQRQAEGLDSKFTTVPFVALARVTAFALQQHPVDTQPGRRRNGPGRRGAAPARPLQRLAEGLAAAGVHDLQRGGQAARRHGGQPLRGLAAHKVLHRHRLAHPQQRAVHHRVGAQPGLGPWVGGQVEAPALYALLPTAEDEGLVGE